MQYNVFLELISLIANSDLSNEADSFLSVYCPCTALFGYRIWLVCFVDILLV